MAYKNKHIKKWSNKDFSDWVKTIGLSDNWQDMMSQIIENTGCTGQDWLEIKNGNDLAKSFDIKNKMCANRVYREFRKIKEEDRKRKNEEIEEKKRNNHEEKEFELNLFGQNRYWKIPQEVNANTTVRRVKELYKAKSGVGASIDDIVLKTMGKIMVDNTTLRQYGIINQKHNILVDFKTHGGCFVNGTKILLSNKKRVNIEDISIGDIVLTYNLNANKLESFP
eukprot:215977_1